MRKWLHYQGIYFKDYLSTVVTDIEVNNTSIILNVFVKKLWVYIEGEPQGRRPNEPPYSIKNIVFGKKIDSSKIFERAFQEILNSSSQVIFYAKCLRKSLTEKKCSK